MPNCQTPTGPAPHLLPLGPEGVEGSKAGELAPHVTEEDGVQLLQSVLHHFRYTAVATAGCGTPSREIRRSRYPPPLVRSERSQEQGGLGLARWVRREGRWPLAGTAGGSAG